MSDKPSRIKLDPDRVESRKRLEQMHPADRFKAMFGLTSGPIQGHERTDADEAAEQSRHRCNNLTDEERAALLEEGLRIINGTTPLNLPASPPKSCPQDPDK